jgi:hypothetical protein
MDMTISPSLLDDALTIVLLSSASCIYDLSEGAHVHRKVTYRNGLDKAFIRMMEDLQWPACFAVENVDCTMVTTAYYHSGVFDECYLFWDEFGGIASRECTDICSVIKLM